MNSSFFIARRMLKGGFEKRISKPIVSLAIIGISLGVAVMILSVSIAVGFQTEVRDKVLGFGSHVQISKSFGNESHESSRMEVEQEWLEELRKEEKIKHVQQYAYKLGILQTRQGTDTSADGAIIRDVTGLTFKGVSDDFDASFIEQYLKEGNFPVYCMGQDNDTILVSKYTADQLQLHLNDKVACFFMVNNTPKQRNYIVGGIFETGLEDFDKRFAFIDLNEIRKLNQWGIQAFVKLNETCQYGLTFLEAEAFGGNGNYRYGWDSKPLGESNKMPLCPLKDTIIRLIATDVEAYSYLDEPRVASVPDTAWISIEVEGDVSCYCPSENHEWEVNYLNDSVTTYKYDDQKITTTLRTASGSDLNYCGGYEVILNDFEDLYEGEDIVRFHTGSVLNVQSIVERHEDIFNWLNMLDMNVYIILSLMIVVAIINMTSALLVLILERTSMIGVLKSFGTTNWSIRKIFLYNGGYLIIKGMLYGNLLALCVILIQNQFGVITLSQSNYYVSVVPMHLPLLSILLINAGAFIMCYLALILPSYIITRISPVRAIRFE